jgi:steroid delta-isomerase-like uncharacterized protein
MPRIGLVLLVSTLFVTCIGSRGMSVSTSPEQARRLVDELYTAWSLHQPERIDAIFTDDGVYEDVAGGQVRRGTSEIKDMLRANFTFAPDFQVTLQSFVVAGDTATTEWVIEGTQTGASQAGSVGKLSATGHRFKLRGASILVFRAGRIANVKDYYDMATFLRQLGATIELPKP